VKKKREQNNKENWRDNQEKTTQRYRQYWDTRHKTKTNKTKNTTQKIIMINNT